MSTMVEIKHRPVLVDKVVDLMNPECGKVFVDATVGDGGHSLALFERCEDIRIIAIDRDPEAIKRSKMFLESYGDRVEFHNINFIEIDRVVSYFVDGVIFDLGLSTFQIFDDKRGFSFGRNSPLDMGMDEGAMSVEHFINSASPDEIADVLYQYGGERKSRRIARRIVSEREKEPIMTTSRLATIVKCAYPPGYHRIHPATRTFQALRIWANSELNHLRVALPKALRVIRPGGVVVVISYHSLEDRIVKAEFARTAESAEYELITRKPITPDRSEILNNRSSRSAKLRAIKRSDSRKRGS